MCVGISVCICVLVTVDVGVEESNDELKEKHANDDSLSSKKSCTRLAQKISLDQVNSTKKINTLSKIALTMNIENCKYFCFRDLTKNMRMIMRDGHFL